MGRFPAAGGEGRNDCFTVEVVDFNTEPKHILRQKKE